jgi:hypothetical protein
VRKKEKIQQATKWIKIIINDGKQHRQQIQNAAYESSVD